MPDQSNVELRERLDQAAVRLMLAEPTQVAEDWGAFLRDLEQAARAENRTDVSTAIEECLNESPATPAAIQAQILRLQQIVEGPPARPAYSLAQDAELIGDFVVEAREHLQSIERLMLVLEQQPNDRESIHATFRAFHTIKGLAGFLELHTLRDLSHEVETLLDEARNGRLAASSRMVDIVLASADWLQQQIALIERGLAEPGIILASAPKSLFDDIRGLMGNGESLPSAETPAPNASGSDTVSGQGETEQPAPAEAAAPIEHRNARTKSGSIGHSAIKVETAKLDFLVDMLGELVIAQSLVRHNSDLATITSTTLLRSLAQLTRITNDVQKMAMSLRMVPVEGLFQKMTRLVRDLARKSGKQAEMETSGNDTELDRNIVEELGDPLMHMVRNAVDHGIETPAERAAAGKAPVAHLRLHAEHQAGYIIIEVTDDGRGINCEKILKKARERGLVENGDHLTDNEVFNLIFEPGFSTAEQVTDLSGRGVGMDVVKKQIQKLRGRIDISSTPGQGTRFTLKVPLTLAIIDGLIVGVGSERYIVPIFAVREMIRPSAGMVSTIENKAEVALVRGRILPVVRLYRRFGISPRSEDPEQGLLLLAEARGRDFCVLVDELMGKQEVVIKNLGETFKSVPGIAGGAILGDGRVGLILDMNGVFSPEMAA